MNINDGNQESVGQAELGLPFLAIQQSTILSHEASRSVCLILLKSLHMNPDVELARYFCSSDH